MTEPPAAHTAATSVTIQTPLPMSESASAPASRRYRPPARGRRARGKRVLGVDMGADHPMPGDTLNGMRALTAEEIRASFVNATSEEAARIPLPGLHEVVWQDREYLGWRDPSLTSRGYLVHISSSLRASEGADEVVGIVLRCADRASGGTHHAMCSLCHATQPAAQVSLWSAARAGQAGRDGASVGTYICDDLGCSHIIRMLPASSPWAIGTGDLLAARSVGLIDRVRSFSASVLAAR